MVWGSGIGGGGFGGLLNVGWGEVTGEEGVLVAVGFGFGFSSFARVDRPCLTVLSLLLFVYSSCGCCSLPLLVSLPSLARAILHSLAASVRHTLCSMLLPQLLLFDFNLKPIKENWKDRWKDFVKKAPVERFRHFHIHRSRIFVLVGLYLSAVVPVLFWELSNKNCIWKLPGTVLKTR